MTRLTSVGLLLFFTTAVQAESTLTALPRVAPGIVQLAKLHESGVSQDVMLAFVQNAAIPKPNAEELIFLHEHGVSTAVVTSLLNRKDAPAAAAAPPANTAATADQPVAQQPPSQPTIVSAEPTGVQSSVIYIPASGPHYTPRYNESYFAPYFGTYPYVGPTFSVGVGFGSYGHHWGHYGSWRHHHHHHGHHHRGGHHRGHR